ncbi:MAG: hypothetical protein CVV44_17685 [Spirochaetae bacterium HGW-Spirochaetae-1]|jgi:outer membrane protein TolC|nr:MAG: hypothetical protein CVV44_17685 [Spirochaetae bacterium HGW-Spirochaetae-1]
MGKNIVTILLLMLFSCISLLTPASAENAVRYTWESCVKTALAHNPDLLSSREIINQKKAARGIARSPLLPQISATASGEKSSGSSGAGYGSTERYAYGITAKQLVFDGFKSVYDLKSADAEINSSLYNYSATSATVRYNLKTAFISLLKAQEMLAILEEIEQRRKHILELVKMKYESGSEHRGSYYFARADYLQSQADVKSAIREISLRKKTICYIMGMEEPPDFSVTGDLTLLASYDLKPDFIFLAANNPTYRKSMSTVNAALYELKSSKLAYSPELYGTGSAGRSGDSPGSMSGNWSVGFEITAPLFSGGETWYSHERAKALYRQAQCDEKSVKNEVMRSLEESWNNLRDSIDTVEVQKETLTAALERSKIGETQYSIGRLTFDNWTIIESNMANTKKAHLTACAAALDAEAQWIYATGGSLDYENKK